MKHSKFQSSLFATVLIDIRFKHLARKTPVGTSEISLGINLPTSQFL